MAAASESDSDEEMVSSSRRRRTCINDLQLRMLLETYQSNQRPSRHMMEKLSRKIGLRVKVVQIWFQNRRAKDKHLVPGTEQITQGLSSYADQKTGMFDTLLFGIIIFIGQCHMKTSKFETNQPTKLQTGIKRCTI